MFSFSKDTLPTEDTALPGRDEAMPVKSSHFVNRHPIQPPFPEQLQQAIFGLGCFWGAEKVFWQTPGVYTTAVGYSGGFSKNPTYQEVCSGQTAHNEVVLVVFDPQIISYQSLLQLFWQSHNPTQGMRQSNDRGTQYRSGIYTFSEQQKEQALQSRAHYQQQLNKNDYGDITTEIVEAAPFYYAEDYHQQYLAKNPAGYCGLGGLSIPY
ncbi:MAG: peptide-methionine (S)-S-oxide reductase MsrA [Gammaproteobacteria bacterium]|nr:peptide-methionine (S)-S-oxide reductase MsrA [Gammaproteobacteria bacterium]